MHVVRWMSFLVACLSFHVALERTAAAGDWPQFMRNAQHTGDAAEEELRFPLGLVAQIRLDDAVLASPAVVDGRTYVVDQMGTAYCIDPDARRIVWKSAPEGDEAMGSNTSSPCVVKGRVYYGTTAGRFHILNAADGKSIRSIDLGWPMTASPVFEHDRIYFQTVGGIVHCLNLDGDEQWRYDHFAEYTEPNHDEFAKRWPGSFNTSHYGGQEAAVRDGRIVTGMGWDHLCISDEGDHAQLVWCNRAALGKDDGIPLAPAIAGDYVYTAWPGVDAAGNLLRVKLADGSFDTKQDQLRGLWAILGTPAVRDETVYVGRTTRGFTAQQFGKGTRWESFYWTKPERFQPVLSSAALSKEHCVFGTMDGELVVVALDAQGADLDRIKPEPFRFRTPHGKGITSSPAIADGRIHFGCDDGFLYVLGPNGERQPREEELTVHERKSSTRAATGKPYAWPSPFGGPHNNSYVTDADLKPPFHLRWAVRSFGSFKQQSSATEDDLVFQSEEGIISCLEQPTGRMRWRTRVLTTGAGWGRMYSGVLCAEGKVFLHGPNTHESRFYCLDLATGEKLWSRLTGKTYGSKSRAAPVVAAGNVAFGYTIGGETKDRNPSLAVVEGWNVETGETSWQIEMKAKGDLKRPTAAADGNTFYFSTTFGSGKAEDHGETIAIDAETGKVQWRADGVFGYGSMVPVVHGEYLYVIGKKELICLNRKTGETEWTTRRSGGWFHGIIIADDYFTHRGYSGAAERIRLSDRKPALRDGKRIPLGAEAHACAPVVLTSGDLSIAISNVGLHVRDANTGELLWVSKGFAPRTCASAIPASGRLFCNPQVSGMMFCFEPKSASTE